MRKEFEFKTDRLLREFIEDAYIEGFKEALKANYMRRFEESFMDNLNEDLVEAFKAVSDAAWEQGREEERASLISALRLYRSGTKTLEEALADAGFPAEFRLQLQSMVDIP